MTTPREELARMIEFHEIETFYEDGRCGCGKWVDRDKDSEHVADALLQAGWTPPPVETYNTLTEN